MIQIFNVLGIKSKLCKFIIRAILCISLKNSNILHAVLHLIKELDDDSLNVVSDAIRDKLESS